MNMTDHHPDRQAAAGAMFRAFFEQNTQYAARLEPDGTVLEVNRQAGLEAASARLGHAETAPELFLAFALADAQATQLVRRGRPWRVLRRGVRSHFHCEFFIHHFASHRFFLPFTHVKSRLRLLWAAPKT